MIADHTIDKLIKSQINKHNTCSLNFECSRWKRSSSILVNDNSRRAESFCCKRVIRSSAAFSSCSVRWSLCVRARSRCSFWRFQLGAFSKKNWWTKTNPFPYLWNLLNVLLGFQIPTVTQKIILLRLDGSFISWNVLIFCHFPKVQRNFKSNPISI